MNRRQIRQPVLLGRWVVVLIAVLAVLLLLSACAKREPAAQEPPQETFSEPETEQVPAAPEEPEPAPEEPEPEPEEPEPAPEIEELESSEESEKVEEAEEAPRSEDDWKLILVNASHPLPENYTCSLKELRNDQRVDERIYPELQQMFDDARAEGIYPLINESFRTGERQQEILNGYVASYMASGLSEEEAVGETLKLVALPGTSEHQLGLALDIIAENDGDSTATWQWLRENCWRYGFILRYPADKEDITGISYEPWHFRYVGVEAAREIMEQGICLEEYLDQD